MGCDGGTIPKRKEIVKNKERQPRQERERGASAAERWKMCALSDWVLTKPIVAGHWGHLFSKECIIEHLLEFRRGSLLAYDTVAEKSPVLDSFHSMKDVKELKLKDNPQKDDDQAATSEDATIKADFVCPITNLETNGKYKFVFSWNCGCVVSERAVKEVPNDSKCLVCQKPYDPWDLVVINPDAKDLFENQGKFLARKMKPHLTNDDKKSSSSSNSTPNGSQTDSAGPLSREAGPSTSRASSSKQGESRDRRRSHRDDRYPSSSQSKRHKS